MPVAAAIAGAAVLGAGASIISANKASKAANRATDKTVAAQEQARQANMQTLSPFIQSGVRATNAIDAMLGNGGAGGTVQTLPAWSFNGVDYYSDGQGGFTTQKPAATGGQSARAAQDAAFENFRNSTGYQFQQSEGQKAITAALGRKGQLESGAAVKSALRFRDNLANQSALQYIGLQQNQQQVGLSAANAGAGVQTNFANNVSAAYQNQGNANANAALSTGAAINSALGSAVSALGYSQGLKSSYGDPWTSGVGI